MINHFSIKFTWLYCKLNKNKKSLSLCSLVDGSSIFPFYDLISVQRLLQNTKPIIIFG